MKTGVPIHFSVERVMAKLVMPTGDYDVYVSSLKDVDVIKSIHGLVLKYVNEARRIAVVTATDTLIDKMCDLDCVTKVTPHVDEETLETLDRIDRGPTVLH